MLCTEARQEAAPGKPDAGRAAQPARAAANDTELFTPRKQNTELLLAGVRHEETQLVKFGDWPPAKGAAARSSASTTRSRHSCLTAATPGPQQFHSGCSNRMKKPGRRENMER